jgi:histidinol-phosphate phosphatase family protein
MAVAMTRPFDAVLFDRDGTLVHDVPYNGDPERVVPMPGARAALDRLREQGFRLGVVTNQSGLARGRFTDEDLASVNARVEALLGPFDTWQVCPHTDADGCDCRKPLPGLVFRAAADLGTTADRCVVVGDIGRDMAAALAAGAAGILVPTPVTLADEVAAAPAVADDLAGAASLIVQRHGLLSGGATEMPHGTVLVARPDSAGDVLVTGPAIRAVAAGAERVVMLCGPRGRAAAEMLPGVDALVETRLPWIDPDPEPVDPAGLRALTERLAGLNVDEAVLFTSYHQSPLPLAVLLRMAGVARISAISDDYPGSLLDVRHRVPAGIPEPERALSLAVAAGYPLPPGDDLKLRVRLTGESGDSAEGADGGDGGDGGDIVVVHPGASVPARACPPALCRDIVSALSAAGFQVVVTGGPNERDLTRFVAGADALDLGGDTSFGRLAEILASARCAVVGNTGPAHLAAAVGTPVVSLFAPTVPFGQWGPFRVPAVRLGRAGAACRLTRATTCPVPGHPCLSGIDPAEVVDAVAILTRARQHEEVAA